MRGKIVFVVGLATGYVLGTRAGRERYEQIKAGAEKVWSTPTVQAGVEKVQEFAGARVDVAKSKLSRQARNALASLIGREPLNDPKQSTSRPASKAPATRKPATRPSSAAGTAAKPAAAKSAAAKPAAAKTTAAKTTSTKPTAATSGAAASDSSDSGE
ncbi:YtxH domain-containing protein [Herbiconiux sp. CPCC 203407]|uniref:YtxH domain-containing protein n=1 Tax=Herbiconiux oxytropis TaxID=2970915 RepID=A0AA42BU85_9MICO|nr:YtxH domain-containing protein [Herbiconiux oxytropis]MCS5720584.1 YtxH domain-containing protein [Herbiconiux oxytropis]MCS5725089.1 YtxH domain-containing protein [Herbiconiux oxytropis]